MNLRTARITNKFQEKSRDTKPRVRHGKKSGIQIKAFIRYTIPLMVIFVIAFTMNLFNSDQERLNSESVKLQGQIKKLNRHISYLKSTSESLKGPYMRERIRHFNLCLIYPKRNQIRLINGRNSKAVVRRWAHGTPIQLTQR